MYPELNLRLQLLNGDESWREGTLDVVVRAGPLEDSGLLMKPLMRIRLGAYASPVELHALYPSRLDASPKVRTFLQFLRERFGSESPADSQKS
jgi:DNA-binding transcriptional LysR family regulator